MEKFECLPDGVGAGKLTDADGDTLVVSGQLLRQIARETAPQLDMLDLALVLHKAADLEWEHAGPNAKRKKLASRVHGLAADLREIAVELHEI